MIDLVAVLVAWVITDALDAEPVALSTSARETLPLVASLRGKSGIHRGYRMSDHESQEEEGSYIHTRTLRRMRHVPQPLLVREVFDLTRGIGVWEVLGGL